MLRFTTANLDFALNAKKVKQDLDKASTRSDVICFQEGKNVNVKRLLADPDWNTNQVFTSPAEQGSGTAWRKSRLTKIRSGSRVGVRPGSFRMLVRHISWVNLKFVDNGQVKRIRVVSLHMPPKRYRVLYPAMLASLAVLIRTTRIPIIIGADWNKLIKSDKSIKRFARASGGKFYGFGIDGFLFVPKKRKQWHIRNVKKIRNVNSDHRYFVTLELITRG